ncbi:recombinase RecT [Aneurinibacillus thermoaerophilus]|uniref:recombinase RecT n=1 Tax=Aneurinibacillus thermoaerophilus TaxID=143495 RepID=UPI002E23A63E|nr:recombinase RecT [Aneurinibacillus thermoaerophilus]MED0738695.1 recombinase RecT [Aneurinibacillus thermoaerophilus]
MAPKNEKNLTSKLQSKAQGTAVSTQTQDNGFQIQLTSMFKQQFKAIQSIVPKHVTPERLIRIGMNATSRNPLLLQCTPESIVGAVVNCAVLGVEPNLLGHAYIVPFYNSKTKRFEAQFQLGYRGLIDLSRRTGQISVVYAREVYEGDEFEFEYGLETKLKHKPCGEDDENKITHFYAVYKLKDGGYDFVVMSRRQVEKHRDKFTKSRDKSGLVVGPWKDHFVEMAKKTVLIRLLKTAPISIEQQETRTILEGIHRDNSISTVKEDSSNIGDAFIQAEYHVVEDERQENEPQDAAQDTNKDQEPEKPQEEKQDDLDEELQQAMEMEFK